MPAPTLNLLHPLVGPHQTQTGAEAYVFAYDEHADSYPLLGWVKGFGLIAWTETGKYFRCSSEPLLDLSIPLTPLTPGKKYRTSGGHTAIMATETLGIVSFKRGSGLYPQVWRRDGIHPTNPDFHLIEEISE